jgi:hypothetical protein
VIFQVVQINNFALTSVPNISNIALFTMIFSRSIVSAMVLDRGVAGNAASESGRHAVLSMVGLELIL